ncbi:MAG: hypothetical protein ACLGIR_05310 [Actinomycetes bacterium]
MARPVDADRAAVRFLVVGGLPLLVVDLEGGEEVDTPILLGQSLFRTVVERGCVVLPRFYGVDLPRGVTIGLTVEREQMRLEDADETTLLRVPRASLDPDWYREAQRLKGTMFLLGRELGVDPDQTPQEVCDLLDAAAGTGRVAGAIVGVAETLPTLPILTVR